MAHNPGKLGRLPHDPVALALAPSRSFGAVAPPPVLDRSSVDFEPGMFSNDTLGDCTCVSVANMVLARGALNGFTPYIDPARVVALFAVCAGAPPDLTTVEGLVYQSVIDHQAIYGFDTGHDVLHGIPGTVATDRESLASAMFVLGSVGIGVTLHERDMDAFGSGQTWDIQPGRDDGAVVGGHAVVIWDYTSLADAGIVRIATWGTLQPASWAWIGARIDEAHALAFHQLDRVAI